LITSKSENILPIETHRLILRDITPDDFDAIHAFESDPESFQYAPRLARSEEETHQLIERAINRAKENPRDLFNLAVILKDKTNSCKIIPDTGNLIGRGSLLVTKRENKEASLGFVIHRDYQNQGYATEVAKALISFAFNNLGMHRVIASGDPDNIASMRVLDKAGMIREGILRNELFIPHQNRWRDTAVYSILEFEFRHKMNSDPHL
jgi:ribosomal-protein-alanine N-acetyltransferase